MVNEMQNIAVQLSGFGKRGAFVPEGADVPLVNLLQQVIEHR
jgi:hypothetical protein